MKLNKKVTKKTLIGDIVKQCPESILTLNERGIECVGCHIATWETLEQTARSHNIDVDELVKELNDSMEIMNVDDKEI
jgi:hybrid cluster-associated redox disulfide protein